MSSIFSKIIAGEIPAEFVWEDEVCVAFADINPQTLGHVLLVPRMEIDKFVDVPFDVFSHLNRVAQIIAKAQEAAFNARRAMLVIEGYGVPHTHLHLFPTNHISDRDPRNKVPNPCPEIIKTSMDQLRTRLIADGWEEFVPISSDSEV